MSLSPSRRRPAATVAVTVAALLVAVLPTVGASPAAALETSESAFTGFTDKSEVRAAGTSVVSSGELAVSDGSAPSGSGTTYYVDSAGGDDAAAGTSANAAWRTLANVNATVYEPGDRILLKAGSSWSASGATVAREAYDYTTWSAGQASHVVGPDATALLAPRGSGTEADPILLSSYGDGPAPELNGLGVVNDVLQLTNQEHWDISNLEISNETAGFDASTFQPARNVGQAPGDENPQTGDLRGIHIQGEGAGTLRGFEIHNVFVRDVTGYTWSVSAAGVDRSKRTGGIMFEGLKGDGQTVTQFEDITIRDSYVANTSFANLVFKQFAGMGTNRYQDLPPGWGDRTAGRMAPDGTLTEDPDWRPHSDVHIFGNYLTNRETQYGWDSMYLTSVKSATVEDNLIDGAGVSGIEMYYADDVIVQNNEVAELEGRTGAADSNGIDPDRATSNILIQGNYVHESGEGILLCGFGFSSAVVRYNIIRDIERNYINPHGDSGVNVVHNNLMYNTVRPIRNNTIGFFESSGDAATYLTARNPHHVFNNVFFNTRDDVAGAAFRTTLPGVSFSDNSYFGPGVVAPVADAAATVADPLLSGNPITELADAVIGSASSPLINAGRDVDLAAIAPGFNASGNTGASQNALTTDFFGVPLTSPPHIGPASYQPAVGRAVVSGVVTDAAGLAVAQATVSYGSGSVTANDQGRYTIEAAAGEYSLVPSAPGYADGAAVPVTLGDRQTVSADLTLGETTATEGSVAGVVTSSGLPLAGTTITLTKGGEAVGSAVSDSAGAYAIAEVPAGDGYVVTGTKAGYDTASRADVVVSAARTVAVDLVLRREAGPTTYAIDELFDDEPTGAFTQNEDGSLVARTAPAVGTVEVLEDAARSGNKYLRINKSSASSATLGVHNTTELNLTGAVTVEARLQRTTTNGTPNQLALYSYTESGWNAGNPAGSTNPAGTIGFAGGKILTHNVTGASTVRNVADYTVGQWYTVRNVIDLDAGTFDFYIDDMTTPVLVDQPLRSRVDDLDYFLFFINGSNVGDLLVDYFRVNTGTPYDYGDTALASVSAAAGGEDVVLTPSADGLTYAGEVDALTQTVSVAVSPRSGFAKTSVNGMDVEAGESIDVSLSGGEPGEPANVTPVPVKVTADDGTQRSYTLSISQVSPSQLAVLRDLSVDGHALSPAFDPYRSGEDNPYRIDETIPASVSSLSLDWDLAWEGQRIQIDGAELEAGATQATVELADGRNDIAVTSNSYAGDFVTYVISVDRAASAPQLDVAVAVDDRCVAGKVVLTVRVTNGEDVRIALTIRTPYGTKTVATLPAGKSATYAFTTREEAIASGVVDVEAGAVVDGQERSLEQTLDFAAVEC